MDQYLYYIGHGIDLVVMYGHVEPWMMRETILIRFTCSFHYECYIAANLN